MPLDSVTPVSTVVCCLEDLVLAYESGQTTRGHIDVTHHITEACLVVAESHRRENRWLAPADVDRNLHVFHI